VPRVLRTRAAAACKFYCSRPGQSLLDLDGEVSAASPSPAVVSANEHHPFVLPQKTDFSLAPESVLSAVLTASGLPDQRVARNRVTQSIGHRPAVRQLIAWVLCGKGRRVSGAFAAVVNAVLGASDQPEQSQERNVWTVLMQVAFCVIEQIASDVLTAAHS
jgi:hypothetical protein